MLDVQFVRKPKKIILLISVFQCILFLLDFFPLFSNDFFLIFKDKQAAILRNTDHQYSANLTFKFAYNGQL